MFDNSFFKPTQSYKEFMILDLVEKNSEITQREIAYSLGVAVSMVNNYINEFEKKGLVKKKKHSTKNIEYFLTKKGNERRRLLNINFLHNSQLIYNLAKKNIINFLEDLIYRSFNDIIIYGAGDVAMIILSVIVSEEMTSNFRLYIIDDDVKKIGNQVFGIKIQSTLDVHNINYDCLLIGSYTYSNIMELNALDMGVPSVKIIKYFE